MPGHRLDWSPGWPRGHPGCQGVCRPSDRCDPLGTAVPFDTKLLHIARVYDYWLGGKDNFAADRELAEKFMRADPSARVVYVDNAIARRVVRTTVIYVMTIMDVL